MGDVADRLIELEMFGYNDNHKTSRQYEKQIDWQRKQLSDLMQHMFFNQVEQEFNRKQRARKRKSLINEFCSQNGFVKKPGVNKTKVYRSQSNYTFKRLDSFKDFLREKRNSL